MVIQNWFQQWSRKKNDLTDLSNTSAEIRKKNQFEGLKRWEAKVTSYQSDIMCIMSKGLQKVNLRKSISNSMYFPFATDCIINNQLSITHGRYID